MAQSADGPHNSPPDANASGSPPEARKPRQSVLEQSINILRSEWRDSGSKERGIDRFRQFDTNGDGMVDFNEFVVGCRSSALSSTQLKDLFDALDGDGNQQLDYREFLDLLNGKKALAHEGDRLLA